jgi:hypothetical protein
MLLISAVIGIQVDHPDLQEVIWKNPGEVAGAQGSDDDSNGYYDDTNGWDFYNWDAVVDDDYSDDHGTHVSTASHKGRGKHTTHCL